MWILKGIRWVLHYLFLPIHARFTPQTQSTPVKRATPITTTFPWASWRFSSPFLSSLVLKLSYLPSSFGLSLFPFLSELDLSSFGARLEDRSDSECESITFPWFSPCSNLRSALCTMRADTDLTFRPVLIIIFPPVSKCLAHGRCLIMIGWIKEWIEI